MWETQTESWLLAWVSPTLAVVGTWGVSQRTDNRALSLPMNKVKENSNP